MKNPFNKEESEKIFNFLLKSEEKDSLNIFLTFYQILFIMRLPL